MSKLNTARSPFSLPGRFGLPLVGEAHEAFIYKQQFYLDRYSKYKSYFQTKILDTHTAILFGYDACTRVLNDREDTFLSRKGWALLEPFLGYGILLQDGIEHVIAKKLIGSAFADMPHAKIFELVFESSTYCLNAWKGKERVLLFRDLRKFTFNVIARLVFGSKQNLDDIKYLESLFSILVDGQLDIFRIDIQQTAYGKALDARRKLLKYVSDKIRVYKDNRDCYDGILINLILRNDDLGNNQLNSEELAIQTLQVLFAGYETTAMMTFWCIYSISKHHLCQRKLSYEIKAHFDPDNPSPSQLNQLIYLDKVILETERLFPPVYAIPRGLSKDFLIDEFLIPKSWNVIVSPLITHRLPHIFLAPNEFRPSRFEDVNLSKQLFGFGLGVHRCLGKELAKLEIKMLLSLLMSKYQFDTEPDIPFEQSIRNSDSYLKKVFIKF